MSTFRRKGRPSLYFQGRTRHGWTQVCTFTADKRLGDKIAAMWETLAEDERAWEELDLVLSGQMTIGEFFDLWRESGRKMGEFRRRLHDVDLEPLVPDFLKVHAAKVAPDTLEHIDFHLRWLLEEKVPFPRSQATKDKLTSWLYEYEGSPGTIRKVHSSWSVFFTYCTDVKSLFERNPMEQVARPPAKKVAPAFYELDVVERLIGAQPTEERRALFALLYGTGIEISVALKLTRGDLKEQRKETRAAGTKTHTRDRIARVADWAWLLVWSYAKPMLPAAKLFPSVLSRHTASDWHLETVEGLKLDPAYPMKNARHHWAVRMLRSGAPVAVVQQQLGHATAKLTLDTYGTFVPTGADMDRWEKAATDYENTRFSATGSANELSTGAENVLTPLTANSRGGT